MMFKTKYLPKSIANYLLEKRWMSRHKNLPKIIGFQHLIFKGCIALEQGKKKNL